MQRFVPFGDSLHDVHRSLPKMRLVILLALCLLQLSLAGCGFSLRQQPELGPLARKPLYLQTSNPYDTFSKRLALTLERLHVPLVDSPSQAAYTLLVNNYAFSLTLITISANNQTRIYRANYQAAYQLRNNATGRISTPVMVNTSRQYVLSSSQLLGDLNYQKRLENNLQVEIIAQMLNQVASPSTLQQVELETAHPASVELPIPRKRSTFKHAL